MGKNKKRTTKTPYAAKNSSSHPLAIAVIILFATLAVYWQVLSHEFINLDDNKYVAENPRVQQGLTWENVKWAFTTKHASNWHPLTWLSHMLDCHLFALNPAGHHLGNLLFHLLNTLLLLLVLHRLTNDLWPSAFVAALFALHPLQAESVAWVAERKNVLGMFFWLLTMGAYHGYAERPGFMRYVLVVILFAFGLMAKPMLVTVPFVLLLLDYWPLRRLGTDVPKPSVGTAKHHRSTFGLILLEKVPLLVLAVVSGAFTLRAQQAVTVSLRALDLHSRIANALISYLVYLRMTIWPAKLAVFYPHIGKLLLWQEAAAAAVLVVLTVLVIWVRRRYRYLLVGWLWYLGTLIPVIGIIQVGTQKYADRYAYVPLVGIFIIIAWGVPDILKRVRYKKTALAISSAALLSALAVCTSFQVSYWHDSITLYEHALKVTQDNHLAHNNLGVALKNRGRLNEAMAQWRLALEVFPLYGDAIANLAPELVERGRADEAIKYCNDFIQQGRDHCQVRNNLGNAFREKGEIDEAIKHYQRALQLKPNAWQVHYNLGLVLTEKLNFTEAVKHFQEALRFSHNNPIVSKALSDAMNKKRQLSD
ncbi:MAG: tetratricopeptide repeat protein [Planctomycetota bacterium]|nr:MAG: tetratricopeptide repeat protein [Planctomycetota bacterium]